MSEALHSITLFGPYNSVIEQIGIHTHFKQAEKSVFEEKSVTCLINLPEEEQDDMLKRIHLSTYGWSWTVYTAISSPLSKYLSDGEITKETELSQDILKSLRVPDQPKDRLLAYLWGNSNRKLMPQKALTSTELYRYPLLDIYHNQDSTPFRYLHRLQQLDILKVDNCVDRVRYCQKCDSGYLNYVDSCPACHSIDITSYDAVHCFTCGHVNDSSEFMSAHTMSCPKCSTTLKHIGVDYDRPLESYHCNDCKQEFAEANVIAKCLSCDFVNDVNGLKPTTFYAYKAGENAQRFLFEEELNPNYNIQLQGTVNPSAFEAATLWKNQLSARHQHQDLLIGLKIANADEYIKQNGDVSYIEFMVQLSEYLEKIFRNTDLSCQYDDDLIYVLLPHFEHDFLKVVYARLEDCANLINSDLIELRVKHWALPDQSLQDVKSWFKERTSELND
ncbi:hypothetical protein L4C34_10245 [Vibrio profundum]|uniref:TackOD1 domain-containing metal-binding protein n=1 Tax=Vibrio profundum TaxID=2910247 RepID=UPI003D0BA4C6